ncbi:hypothetical protein ACQRB4_06735 [Peptoniphilaceae bacterium SGI.097]
MANLSQEKRQRMLAFLDTIRQEHKDDDDVLIALGEIESELNAKKYGLVWEQHEEAVDVMMRTHIPVFTEDAGKEITTSAGGVYVPTDFDTIEKAFSGVKTAEKGIKQGLSRSNADFGSPCLLYSVMDFCRSDVRWHRGV